MKKEQIYVGHDETNELQEYTLVASSEPKTGELSFVKQDSKTDISSSTSSDGQITKDQESIQLLAFKMRLKEMNPLDHFKRTSEVIPDTAFNNDVIVKWKRIVKQLVEKEEAFIAKGDVPAGLYPLVATYPTGMFAYLFDLDKAKVYIKENDILPIKIRMKEAIQYIDQQQLDPIHRFEEYDKHAPIIILSSPLFKKPFCISGNLKIADAYKIGSSGIKTYYILPDDYLHFMYDGLSKAMHMFHLDLQKMTDPFRTPCFDDLYISKYEAFLITDE